MVNDLVMRGKEISCFGNAISIEIHHPFCVKGICRPKSKFANAEINKREKKRVLSRCAINCSRTRSVMSSADHGAASAGTKFVTIRKISRLKQDASKLMAARTAAFVYYPAEPVGFRFRLRRIEVIQAWNKTLKTTGILQYPLSQSQRLSLFMKAESEEIFLVFATLSK